MGKSKGLLQVLWERGFIDETSIEKYKLTGKNDNFGIVNNSTSLREMMTMCYDFLHEQGMMKFIGRKVGVEVILTPKCHAELAGKGVEYMWACSKNHYRNISMNEKKRKEKFTEAVRKCLSVDVITLMRIRNFAERARTIFDCLPCN